MFRFPQINLEPNYIRNPFDVYLYESAYVKGLAWSNSPKSFIAPRIYSGKGWAFGITSHSDFDFHHQLQRVRGRYETTLHCSLCDRAMITYTVVLRSDEKYRGLSRFPSGEIVYTLLSIEMFPVSHVYKRKKSIALFAKIFCDITR